MMKRLLVLALLLWATPSFAGVARFIDYGLATGSNDGTSWANAYRTCGRVDSLIAAGTIVAGDTIVFKPNDTLYDCSISLPARAGNPQVWTLFCDSTFYANKTGAHYSRYSCGPNAPVLYGGHRVTDDATDPSNAWIQHSGNIYKARWKEKTYTWQFSQGSFVCPLIQNHDSMLVMHEGSVADISAKGECYYDDTKDTIYVWMLGPGAGGGDPDGTPFILSRASVFHQTDDESTTRGWGSVPGTCCAPPWGAASRIKISGLDLRGGSPAVIYQNGASARMDSSIIQHCHLSRGSGQWGQNGSVILSDGVGSLTSKNNQVLACSLGWGGTRTNSGSSSWPSGMFTHGGAITLYTQEQFKADSCYFYGWAEFGLDYKMDGGAATSYRQNRCTYSIFNPNPGSPSWSRHALRMAVKQLRDSVYGCIFVDGDHNIFYQADGQQSGGAVSNDSSFVGFNTFYNTGDFAYVGEFLAARCGVGHKIMYNVIHDYRPGAGFNDDIGVFAHNNYPTDGVCVDVFGVIDSNAYYDPTSNFTFDKASYGNSQTITQWRSAPSFDVNSIISGSGLLTDPANGDYSPTAAVPTVNITFGGRTWTRYGAIQGASAIDTCPTVTRDAILNGAIVTDLTPNYQFDISDLNSDSVYYKLLQDSVSPPTTVRFSGTVATPINNITLTERALSDRKTYYWRIVYADTIDQSGGDANASCVETTSVFTYFTDTVKCPVVTQVTPTNGGTVTATSTNLTANFQTDGFSNLIIRLFGEPSDPTPDVLLITDTLTADSTGWTYNWTGLTNGLTYYWQIIATDPDCADTNSIFNFAVAITGNAPPTRLDGVIINGTRIGKINEWEQPQWGREAYWMGHWDAVERRAHPGLTFVLANPR